MWGGASLDSYLSSNQQSSAIPLEDEQISLEPSYMNNIDWIEKKYNLNRIDTPPWWVVDPDSEEFKVPSYSKYLKDDELESDLKY